MILFAKGGNYEYTNTQKNACRTVHCNTACCNIASDRCVFRAPSDREAVDLALPSLRAFVSDIEKDDISILKSYQKDTDTIVVLKAGGVNYPGLKSQACKCPG